MAFQRVLLPKGLYHGKIVKQDLYATKGEEGGTPYFGFDVILTAKDNEVGKRVDLEQPTKRQFNLWLSEKAFKGTMASLRFLGFTAENLTKRGLDPDDKDVYRLNPWHEKHVSFVGQEVSLDITHQKDQQDNDQESIWLNRSKKPLSEASKKATLDRVATLFRAYQQEADKKKGIVSASDTSFDTEKLEKSDQGEVPDSFFDKQEENF